MKDGWMDRLGNSSLKKDKGRAEKNIHAALSSCPFRPWSNKREGDRWRKRKQIVGESARSRAGKLSTIRWTHIAHFLFPSIFLSSFTLSFLSYVTLQAKRCWRDSLLPTENLLHRKERRGRANGQFGSPNMSEQMGMQSTSGYREFKSHPLLRPAKTMWFPILGFIHQSFAKS